MDAVKSNNQKMVHPYFAKIDTSILTSATTVSSPSIFKYKSNMYDKNIDSECSRFDLECRQRYGEKTCILYQLDTFGTYQVRILDSYENGSPLQQTIEKSSFYVLIPKMLVQKYTVVIVEYQDHTREVTAVHLPVQVQLSNPPIIQ